MNKGKSKKILVYENKALNLVVHYKVYDKVYAKKKLIKKEKQNDR